LSIGGNVDFEDLDALKGSDRGGPKHDDK